VLAYPHLLGLGLSEETGLLLRPGQAPEVFGEEVVLVVDGRRLRTNTLPVAEKGQPVGGQGFEVSLLVAGDRLPE
jgi:cyanophycinase